MSESPLRPGGSRYLQMELRTSPHLARGVSVAGIMRNVLYALAPSGLEPRAVARRASGCRLFDAADRLLLATSPGPRANAS